jgi:septum formation protein
MSNKDSDTTRAVALNAVKPTLILSLRHELQWVDRGNVDDDLQNDNSNNKNIRLILASASPRRREILDMMGLQGRFQVIPSPLNETALQLELMAASGSSSSSSSSSKNGPPPLPMEYARILAEEKARALADDTIRNTQHQQQHHLQRPILILASDTIVDLDGVILEKPKDATEAHDMLSRLSGAEHCVHTGVAIYRVRSTSTTTSSSSHDDDDNGTNQTLPPAAVLAEKVTSFTDTARVRFARLSPAEIQAYIETQEPMDKAGSYGIQGMGGQFVTHVEGDFFTVMGLPMHRTSRELAQAVLQTLT